MSEGSTRPGFAVDIDNVLAQAEGEVQRIYTELTDKVWPATIYASAGGLDKSSFNQDLVEKIFDYFHARSIPRLPSFPGAQLALQILHRRYRVIIITARRSISRLQTIDWLYFHGMAYDEIYHTDEKANVPEQISMAVDDHPVHAKRYSEQGIPVFLMDQPWNRFFYDPLVTRVNGWDMLIDALRYRSAARVWPARMNESSNLREIMRSANQVFPGFKGLASDGVSRRTLT